MHKLNIINVAKSEQYLHELNLKNFGKLFSFLIIQKASKPAKILRKTFKGSRKKLY